MTLDVRTAQTQLEQLIEDTTLYTLGSRFSVASMALLRAVVSQGATGTALTRNDLAIVTTSPSVAFRFSPGSTAADDGATVIKPNDMPGPGRWLSWARPTLRFAPVVGGDSATLDQATSGPLRRVLVLDKPMSEEQINSLIAGEVPAVVIVALGDDPEDQVQAGGQWNTIYEFDVTVIDQNLRGDRQAAQGPDVSSDTDPGGNQIDGWLQSVILGTQLCSVESGIREIKPGRGRNWTSEYGQRRINRSRLYRVFANVQYPNAPNEIGPTQGVNVQAQLAAADAAKDSFDPLNYLIAGALAAVGSGLTQAVSAGQAQIAGAVVNYAGESHAFAAYADTYRDLKPDGTMTFIAVAAGSDPPDVTTGALRIGVTTTTGFNVVSDALLAATLADYGPVFFFPLT